MSINFRTQSFVQPNIGKKANTAKNLPFKALLIKADRDDFYNCINLKQLLEKNPKVKICMNFNSKDEIKAIIDGLDSKEEKNIIDHCYENNGILYSFIHAEKKSGLDTLKLLLKWKFGKLVDQTEFLWPDNINEEIYYEPYEEPDSSLDKDIILTYNSGYLPQRKGKSYEHQINLEHEINLEKAGIDPWEIMDAECPEGNIKSTKSIPEFLKNLNDLLGKFRKKSK